MFHLKRKYEEKIPFVKMDWNIVTYNISKYSKLTFKCYNQSPRTSMFKKKIKKSQFFVSAEKATLDECKGIWVPFLGYSLMGIKGV